MTHMVKGMEDKKTVMIAVLCVATVLFLGLWSNSVQEASTLNSKYVKVVEDYNRLNSDYSKLTSDYSELKTFLDGTKAIAESAEWVSEDGRLKVTSELILSGTYWVTYTVRVNVTNIGNESIDKVVIFFFRYIEGKFDETYFAEYRFHSVEDLYIGETYSYDFTYSTKDMTSYKVLAVVG